MPFNNVVLSAEQALPPLGHGLLVEIKPNTIFVDKKPVGEDGIRVTVASLAGFEKIVVKIPGIKAPVDPEKVNQKNLSGNFTFVRFSGFSGKLWQDYKTKEVRMSASATNMEIVNVDETDIDIFKEDDA